MGGFDAYSYQIRLTTGFLPLDVVALDRLQHGLLAGAPTWSSRVRLSRLGPWHVGESFDIAAPGALFDSIEANLPGGARAKGRVVDTPYPERSVRLTGASRGVAVDFDLTGPLQSGAPASFGDILITTTKRELDGQASGQWVGRVFHAMCEHVVPRHAVATSLGERRGSMRFGLSGRVEWLTYLGPAAASRVNVAALRQIEGIDLEALAGGLWIRIDPEPGFRRRKPYWERLKRVDDLVGWVRADAKPTVDRTQRKER